MKSILYRTGMLFTFVLLLSSFGTTSKAPRTLTNYVYADGYLFEFDIPANFCGTAIASNITVLSIYDGTNTYPVHSQTGYVCWDSVEGKFLAAPFKIRFYVGGDLVEVIITDYLENWP